MSDSTKPFEPGSVEEVSVPGEVEPAEGVVVSDPEAETARMTAAEHAQQEVDANVEKLEGKNEDAVSTMVQKVRELRGSIKFIRGQDRQEKIDQKVDGLAQSFSESDRLKILGQMLPNRAHAQTETEKFRMIIMMGVDSKYWSSPNFRHDFDKGFGKGVEQGLMEQEAELRDALLVEFPELGEEVGELQAAA